MRPRILIVAILLSFLLLSPCLQPDASTSVAPISRVDPVLFEMVQHSLPKGSSGPWEITSDRSGDIWFVEQESNQIGSFNQSTGSFSEYRIPTAGSLPQDLSLDANGNVWFTELTTSSLGELTPSSGVVREYRIPQGPGGLACGPIGVTAARGAIWFTCEFSNQIDEYSPATARFSEYNLPEPYSAPIQILFDSAGNFWFNAADAGMLGYVSVPQLKNGTTDGINEFAPINSTYVTTIENPLLPSGQVVTSLSIPGQIAFAPGNESLWITEHGGGSFDRYDIGTKTLVKLYTSIPSSSTYPQSLPNGIDVDSSGVVWIAEHYGNRIAEFDPSTGELTEYPIPCCGKQLAGTLYLTLGVNGTVWFSEYFGNAIGELIPIPGSTAPSTSLMPRVASFQSGGNATFNVSIFEGSEAPNISGQINLSVAGISWTGRPNNITAYFTPLLRTRSQTSNASTTLELRTENLRPGIYYLTVVAALSQYVYAGRVVELVVKPSSFDWFLVVGIVALIVAVGAFSYVLVLKRRQTSLNEE